MKKITADSGFSVLELLIVISIFIVVSSLVLANYPGFNERLAVRRAAEDIASNVRQVQAYGLAVKEFGPASFPGYGAYFQTANPDSYILFADTNRDFSYQAISEKVSDLSVQANSRIYQLCANVKSNPPGDCSLATITVTYTRPDPQVTLKGNTGVSYGDVEIKIQGSRGTTRTVVLWLSGQISVEEP